MNLLSSQILINSLSDLPSRVADLPPELHTCIEIVTAQLNGQVSSDDRDILSSDVEYFLENITTVSDVLSAQLAVVAEYLCKIANPTNVPSLSDLSSRVALLQEQATMALPRDLQEARPQLVNAATSLLSTHRSLLETSIRILEQTQHGALARHQKASAELLHTRATVLNLQAKIHTFSHPPPPEFVAALKEYRKSQGSGEKALRDREALAKRELELYDRAGEKVMRDLARRKEFLVNEADRVEKEVEKLEREGQ